MDPSHCKGASNELLVASDYVRMGFQVYFPTVRQGPTDFVVDKAGTLLRVQVKTATWITSGAHRYLQCRVRTGGVGKFLASEGNYDLLVVVHQHEVWEIPASEVSSSNICLRGSKPDRPPEKWDRYLAPS